MTVLDVQDLGVSFGAEILFEHISFQVGDRDKVALVGVNGAGKTTLFRILTGSFSEYSGACYRSREARLGYMEQHTCAAGARSVYEELIDVFSPLLEMEAALEQISTALLEDTQEREALIARQELLTERFHREGGLTFRSRARAALVGLGFGEAEFERPTGELSGGQRSKLVLARLLLSGANFLLLDEPTNHLDIKAVEWLEGFLQEFPGAVLVISHDRYFLDRIANRTVELQHGKLTAYTGNYSEFLQKKEMLQQAIADKYEQDLKEIARLEGIVAQQRQWNREKNIRTAESKLKQIARIRAELAPPERAVERIHFDFTPRRTSGNDVLTVRGLSKSFGARAVFSGLDFHVSRGEKGFLLGPNGCGKTTLLRLCNGEDQPDGGQIIWGAAVQIGYFDQVQSGLNLEKQALHEVWDSFPNRTETEIRSALAAFLFKGDDVYKLLGDMSGGERARIALLKLMLGQYNVLLLDEPTNHLDAFSREALEDTLLQYNGTMLIVSHDRYFINKLADRVLYMTGEGLQESLGNYDAFLEKWAGAAQDGGLFAKKAKEKKSSGGSAYQARKERQANLRRMKTALAKAEAEIAGLEREIAGLEAQIQSEAGDYEALQAHAQALEQAQALLEHTFSRWEELQEALLELEAQA